MREVPKHINQHMYVEDLHPNDYLMACNREITYAYNALKIIHLSTDFNNEFSSKFCNNKYLPLNISLGNI